MRCQGKKLAAAARLLALNQLITQPDDADTPDAATVVDDALAAWGLVADSPAQPTEGDTFWLWPENLPTFHLWRGRLQTQWHVDMSGPTGLDYPGVECVLRIYGIRGQQRVETFSQLQAMELASLAAWQEEREKQDTP